MKLTDQISDLPGIGPKLTEGLMSLGLKTINDLLFFLPRKYDDYSLIIPIKLLKPGQVTVKAKLSNIKTRRSSRGLTITEALASDETNSLKLVWFNQPYRQKSIKSCQEYFISGVYKLSNRQFSIINPAIELASDIPINSARIIPIYKENKIINSRLIRATMAQVLPLTTEIKEYIPTKIVTNLKFLPLSKAVHQLHYPQTNQQLAEAKKRFQFNELFPILLANELTNRERLKQKSTVVPFDVDLARFFVSKLPFTLTDDQRRVIWQIYQDMQASLPMNRLVEGDVGSGKTVVAVMAAVMALSAGFKVAFMAPTELLAKQHATTVAKLLKPLGMDSWFTLLTGSMGVKQKKDIIAAVNKQSKSFVVGTHSLLTCGIDWSNLVLIIIDEQHRFGVDQRMSLQKQAGYLPHFLSTTATPIPRSLALTIFNDLDLSRLKSMPSNRKAIKSDLISPAKYRHFREILNHELTNGRQAYIVCPYIHQKDDQDRVSLEYIYEHYSKQLPLFKVAMIHGQLSSDEQTQIMEDFINNKIKVLIATTVIEVGVDVANASVMVIYGPERFGLAQLHQLRGRVGRGVHNSFCFLMLNDSLEPINRLRQFVNISDGFELSELDLALRGPGAVYGKLQHGKGGINLLTLDDHDLIQQTKQAVAMFFDNKEKVVKYKQLAKRVEAAQQLTNLN